MNYRFDWSVLWSGQTGAWLLQGIGTTLELSLIGWLIAVALGIGSAALACRRLRRIFSQRAAAGLDVFLVLCRAAAFAANFPGLAARPRRGILGRRLGARRLSRRALRRSDSLRHRRHPQNPVRSGRVYRTDHRAN